MSSKKWLAAFLATVLALGACVLGFNFLTDPFGVFPGSLWEWPSYEMTINPRTAKLSYLEKHHQEYDSYIIGCSSTSSYPTEQLNEYFDASFYNMIMYGADMLDVEQLSAYLIEHYTVKNLVVNVYIDNATTYDTETDPLSAAMPAAASGENPVSFYSKFLLSDPRHGADKLSAFRKDTWLIQNFDIFNAETGAYDKKERDVEPIGAMADYLEAYPVFADYPKWDQPMYEDAVAGTLKSLAAIRDLCAGRGINFMVVCAPVYWEHLDHFHWAEVEDFYTRLAQVTPYWDFTMSSVSFEPRYFYDSTHFRNCVGKMALARIFGDESVYVPEDFGAYVTAETVAGHLEEMRNASALPEDELTADVPVLMYHHIGYDEGNSMVVSPERFEEQIAALAEAGYQAVTPDQLSGYVNRGEELPEKPVVITFDDGYLSNYEYAYPILEKYGMCATIFVVGSTVGNTEYYKDTEYPITPHFSYEQGAEMVASGVISIQSHTYDMHQWAPYEQDQARENILRREGETEEDYRAALSADCDRIRSEITAGTGEETVHVLAYPGGKSDTLAQATVLENGFDITFTTEPGSNTLVRGMAQSLLCLNRFAVEEAHGAQQVLELVSSARG